MENFAKAAKTIQETLPQENKEVHMVLQEFLAIYSSQKDALVKTFIKFGKNIGKEEDDEDVWTPIWNFGHSLHFLSTVFTTQGYGARTPITYAGKALTIIIIITMIPFFIHCVATSAVNINHLTDKVLGAVEKNYEDLEELTNEQNKKERRTVLLKGVGILVVIIFLHMLISSIYHVTTTKWSFGDW